MNIWIITAWDDGGDRMNEVMDVIFDEAFVAPKVAELFAEDEQIVSVKVETWYRDADDPDASFYEVEMFWREDE